MMPLTLAAVKQYCRIDGDDDDELVLSLMDAVPVYLDEAGISVDTTDLPIYQLAVKAYVLHLYDHRGLTENTAVHDVPGLRNIITQRKLIADCERIVRGGGDD